MSAPPKCCIAEADGQPWPCRSAWLVAFPTSSVGSVIDAADAAAGSPKGHYECSCEMSIAFAGAASDTDLLNPLKSMWPPCEPLLMISTG